MARIYIETTIFSFYFNARSEPEMVARENWSRRWHDAALAGSDELVTSLAVTDSYISHYVMPDNPGGDALHLAAASFHRCDFLVTWNCRHLANANKFGHIRRVNDILGLGNPMLVTPLELLNEDTTNG